MEDQKTKLAFTTETDIQYVKAQSFKSMAVVFLVLSLCASRFARFTRRFADFPVFGSGRFHHLYGIALFKQKKSQRFPITF